jgi:pimeloyl-ACP methyl ester carboxylesterase
MEPTQCPFWNDLEEKMTDRLEQKVILCDGRTLGYADLGDPQGIPVLHFHGGNGSRYEGLFFDKTAQKLGIRLIVPDRPGLGLSTYKPERRIVDWADDITDLANFLQLERFGVYGISGGGPYALACAWKIPQLLISAMSVSGLGPFSEPDATQGMSKANIQGYASLQKTPWMYYLSIWMMKRTDLRKMMGKSLGNMAEADQKVFEKDPEFVDIFIRSFKESMAQKARGSVHDARLWVEPWGFSPQEISMKVHVWQGEKDQNVSPAMGRYLAKALPNCEAHFFPDDGHLSLTYNHTEEILQIARGR